MPIPRTSMLQRRAYNARVLAVCHDGKIFVIDTPDGRVELPGGGSEVEDDGRPDRTAIRELGEEIGVYIEKAHRLVEIERRDKSDLITGLHISLVYKVTLSQEEIQRYKPETPEGKVLRISPNDLVHSVIFGRMTTHQQIVVTSHLSGQYDQITRHVA